MRTDAARPAPSRPGRPVGQQQTGPGRALPPHVAAGAPNSAIAQRLAPATPKEKAKASLDPPASGPWSSLSWETVAQGAKDRIDDPSIIDQGALAVCGPAVVMNAQADLQPERFATSVRRIFETATIDGTRACAELLGNSPPSGTAQVDWMYLSAMRDTESALFDFEGTAEEDFSGITMPAEIVEWMEDVLGCASTRTLGSYQWGEVANAKETNRLLAKHGKDLVVVLLVDAKRLQKIDSGPNHPNHWIRLKGQFSITDDAVGWTAFTWGSDQAFEFPRDDGKVNFEDVLFEIIIGALKPGIDLG